MWSDLGSRVGGALSGRSGEVKRVLDVALAGLALIVLLPLVAAVALAARLDGPGSVLVRETRVGSAGSPFSVVRFRARRRILPASSLDALPQLLSVVAGRMSLVGPRAALPAEVEAHGELVERRLAGRPGMTGLWALGGRSDLSWADSVRLDLYYVENRSTTVDLLVLRRTLAALWSQRAAR